MTDTTKRKSSHDLFSTEVLENGTTFFRCTNQRLTTTGNLKMILPCDGTLFPLDVVGPDDEGGRVVRFQCHRCKYDLNSYVYAHESLAYPLQDGVVRDVMNLASGTIAVIARAPVHERPASSLTCEAIQRTWWAWVEDRAWNAVTYERWQDAWEAWVLYQNDAPVFGTDSQGNDTFDLEAVYGDAVVDTLSKRTVVAYLRQQWEEVKLGEEAWAKKQRESHAVHQYYAERYCEGMAQALASAAARFQRTLKELTGEEVR